MTVYSTSRAGTLPGIRQRRCSLGTTFGREVPLVNLSQGGRKPELSVLVVLLSKPVSAEPGSPSPQAAVPGRQSCC